MTDQVSGDTLAPLLEAPRHVYVHVPFCARRCSYCDFSIAVRREVPVDQYLDALGRELVHRHPLASRTPIDTLYFGGGTPSLLGGQGVRRALELLAAHFGLHAGTEVTLEANPDDVMPEATASWRAAGVNRLSIGSQTFDAGALAWMHRSHTAEQIGTAVEVAKVAGLDNLSLDLIFALPASLRRDWRRDLEGVIALDPAHVSLYGLTVEQGTPLGKWRARGEVREAGESRYEREFLLAHELLSAAGYEHYEVSNYARAGRRSRHNSSYWLRVPYAGLGPSAHAFDGSVRRWNVPAYAEWERLLVDGRIPTGGEERLTDEETRSERVYLGLRTDAGLVLDEAEVQHVQPWIKRGWARLDEPRLVLTPTGWLRLDALATDLTHFGNR